ncbi:MAG TPA: DAK2 domain-containing protein [Capillimicrobium sp.]|nr:DAK2 domain-containing protein [Capillimicrobium sp.]
MAAAPPIEPSLLRFRAVVEGALAHLESRRQEVNDLNVFPVADGDTGDNMALTLRACLAELDQLAADLGNRSIDDIGRNEIVERVAGAALLGARGNSGVILSQLIRGAAEELISRPGELVDPVLIGAAMARAADRGYGSVREPAEGTMLTVMREMASRIATEIAHMPDPRLGPEATPEEQNAAIADILERAIEAGEASVKRGPELLPVLREVGVVDAGGYGVTIIFAGIVAALRGTEGPELEHHHAPAVRHAPDEHQSTTFRYCTNFAVVGQGLDGPSFVPTLEALGDSVLVVGDAHTLRVHVHTDDPQAATAVFEPHGEISHLDVADMYEQVEQRAERLAEVHCRVVAVAAGEGMAQLFRADGAYVVDGGPTLNPSTNELLAGIHAANAAEVVLLPNSPNVIMAAERAAELAEKPVVVVPSRSQQAGLTALVAHLEDRDAEANAAAMRDALVYVRIGSVAPAARADVHGRFEVGDAVGFVDDEIIAWGDPQETLAAVIRSLSRDAEIVTCISGDGAPVADDVVAAMAPDGVELELKVGGQPAYWWLLAAE